MFDIDVRQSHREAMPYGEYLAMGETMHYEYYDGELHMNPPSRRHVVIARRLTRLLEDAAPATCEVLPEFGWRMKAGYDFEPDVMVSERGAPGPDLLRVAPYSSWKSPHHPPRAMTGAARWRSMPRAVCSGTGSLSRTWTR